MLESTFGKRIPKSEKTTEKTKAGDAGSKSASAVATGAAKQKKRRKRKIRLPKKYDPTSKPDPERWLPLRERTYYRGKQAAVGKGTQDAVGSDQSAPTTITTSTGAQRSMPTSKTTTTTGSASTQPKPTPPPGKAAAAKRKGKR